MKIWIVGKRAQIATNGHVYIAEPFIAFATEAEADAAVDMVMKVSGERPMKASVTMMTASERADA